MAADPRLQIPITRQDFAVDYLETAAILRHLGFPLKKIALRSKGGMAAFIEQLRNDVYRVRLEEVERMEAVKARREQQRQDAMANFITLSDIVKPMPKPEAR